MQRYFVWFGYDGSRYHGWQAQPNAHTVQEELERALSLLLGQKIEVTGAGRTDAGVHAKMMVAHFDVDETGDLLGRPQGYAPTIYKLNCILPDDISVDRIEPVSEDMHARFSAVQRTYHYYIHTKKDPFLRAYSYELMHTRYDFDAMNEAAAMLLEYDDFASFCKSQSDNKTTLCRVTEARWVSDGDGRWHFVITANRFLRNMVRAIVGTLLKVGRGKLTIGDFRRIIESCDRCAAGDSAAACGLFLMDIKY